MNFAIYFIFWLSCTLYIASVSLRWLIKLTKLLHYLPKLVYFHKDCHTLILSREWVKLQLSMQLFDKTTCILKNILTSSMGLLTIYWSLHYFSYLKLIEYVVFMFYALHFWCLYLYFNFIQAHLSLECYEVKAIVYAFCKEMRCYHHLLWMILVPWEFVTSLFLKLFNF